MRLIAGLTVVGLAVLFAACGSDEEAQPSASPTAQPSPAVELCGRAQPPTAEANLFPNGGFEEGHDPWFALKPPDFAVSDSVAHSGKASALLRMRDPVEATGVSIRYLVQEVAPKEMPEVVSGYYRSDNWLSGTPIQYLQFVAIVVGAANRPPSFPNHQIRYLLAGIDQEPFQIDNAKFVFLSKDDPEQGKWIHFQRDLRKDFKDLWGDVPKDFTCIRFLFEVRYDSKVSGDGPAQADAYYDDLYLGPAPPPE